MRTNRAAIYILTPLTIISVVLSIILKDIDSFCSNVLLGVFGSSLLTLIMAILNYFNERRKTCELFYQCAKKAAHNYYKYHVDYDFDKKINTVLLMNEFDYTSLDNAYGDFAFLFNNKKWHKEIGTKIYQITLDAREIITEKSFHFNEYKSEENGNKPIINILINELDEFFYEKNITTFNDLPTTIITHNSIVADKIDSNLVGWYYELMYPNYKIKRILRNTITKNNKSN